MPPDITKLYLKSHADYFEGSIGYGEWKPSLWGNSLTPIIPHGITLSAKWLHGDYEHRVHDFETICHGLWGITGAMFTNLVKGGGYLFDLQSLLTVEDQTSANEEVKLLIASHPDQSLCVENLYKWRFLMPCACRRGLISLLNDERLFAQAHYRALSFLVSGNRKQLTFDSSVEFVISRDKLPILWGAFPDGKKPEPCPGIANSTVDFLVHPQFTPPYSQYLVDEGALRIGLDQDELLQQIFDKMQHIPVEDPDFAYEVAELESTYLNVLKRVQSSLSIRLENKNEDAAKFVRFQQPLPYWLVPQIHTLTFVLQDHEGKDIFACTADECFIRNQQRDRLKDMYRIGDDMTKAHREFDPSQVTYAHYMHPVRVQRPPMFGLYSHSGDEVVDHTQPFIIYEKEAIWNIFAFSIKLPPKSRLVARIELQKNRILYDDLHVSIHRGQGVPAALIIDMTKTSAGHVCIKGRTQGETKHASVYFAGPIFSYIVFPDTTMTFNVMAGSGVVVGLLFGICFNTLAKNWSAKIKHQKEMKH
ncbi:GPI transamidase component PIG-T [Babesia duncani]|uniref:GPI transamidase component PIG-T n=1 Tax=Babesia duncani TaxID=323732 RepID=A0AAD9PKF4_9APIC|nr:GPI transamidase component PIG-T [Babesia duncani]